MTPQKGRIAAVLPCAIFCAACGAPRLVTLPTSPIAPATDGREAIAQAVQTCDRVNTLTAEVGVSGSIDGQRVRGRMIAGVAKPASARLEAAAPFGAPIFIFVARDQRATLLLPRDDRVLSDGRPAEVLEAAAGVPLDAIALREALTGCASSPDAADARAVGEHWRLIRDGTGELYLRRDKPTDPWRIVATVRPDWRADYSDFEGNLPRKIRLTSADRRHFDLRLALSQVEVNPVLGADAFMVQIPRSMQPITLDELRHSRPGVRKN